jgi:hypothetical protein
MSVGSTLHPRTRNALIKAWFGDRTVDQLARRFKVSAILIRKFWECQRDAGRLPAQPTPRPHFADRCATPAEPVTEVDAIDPETDGIDFAADDAPIGGPMGLRIPEGDPLLCALRLVHGGEPWRRLDGMPAHTLAMELDGHAPSRARVAELAATRDVYVAALMRRQPEARPQ